MADLSEKCFPMNVMIGKEDADLTARVKARVLAEIEAESKPEGSKDSVAHIRSRRFVRIALAAALILSFGLVAYAISCIHAVRQQDLRAELHMDQHPTESYVEYEVPDEPAPGTVLLSAISDGEFQIVYVNVSPVTEEEVAGYPEKPTSFYWKIIGSDLHGFADPWFRPGTGPINTPEELLEVVRRDAYDAQTQTLTLCCRIFSEPLAGFLENRGSAGAELELFLAEDYIAVKSFGRVSLAPTEEERRSFDFGGVIYIAGATGEEMELVGLELTPISAVWRLRFAEAEAAFVGNDPELQRVWANEADRISRKTKIVFSDGSGFSPNGALHLSYEDGVVSCYSSWLRAIDIHDVQQITLDDRILWENR